MSLGHSSDVAEDLAGGAELDLWPPQISLGPHQHEPLFIEHEQRHEELRQRLMDDERVRREEGEHHLIDVELHRHQKQQAVAEAPTIPSQEDVIQQMTPTIYISSLPPDQVHWDGGVEQAKVGLPTVVKDSAAEEGCPPKEPPSPPKELPSPPLNHAEMGQWFYRYSY